MKYVFGLITLLCCFAAHATGVSSNLTYQGRIVKPDGNALEAASVTFTLQVRSPDANNCVLYEEEHTLNMTGTGGVFSITLGGGTRTAPDPGLNFKDVFSNALNFAGPLTCDSGSSYTPVSGHQRKLRLTFNDGGGAVAITPDMNIRSVPYAFYAEKLQGLGAADMLQVSGGNNLSQANLQSVFTGSNYTDLMDIINGTSTKYMDSSPTSSVGFNGQRLTNIADPTGAQDAATKNYCDMNMGGSAVDTNIGVDIGPAIGDGKVLTWDAAGNRWVAEDPVTGMDNLGNHTATMDLDMDGNKVINMADPTAAQDGVTKNYADTKLITKNLPAAPAVGQNGQALRWNNGGNAWEYYTPVSAGADNLGDHTATQNIELGPNFISRDGDNEGLSVDASGNITFSGTLAMSTNRITGVGDPTGAQDASTKNYSDTKFITKNLPAVPAVGQNGQALRWNNGGNAWEYYTPSTGNVSDTRDMIAGSGLTGGGTLAADRTFNVGAGTGIAVAADSVAVDINGVAAEATADNADKILIYDNSASALKSMTRANFLSGLGAGSGDINNGGNTFGGAITIGTDDNFDLGFQTNGAVNMTIKNDGNVGIGTASPGAKLEVAGQVKITGGTPGAGKVLTSDAAGLASWQAPGSGADDLGNHTATGALNMSSNLINNVTDPAAAQDAATKNYVDTKFITKTLPSAPAAGQNGQALRWNNGGAGAWEYYTPVSGGTTMSAGNGLTGGGDLSANRSFDVGAGAGIGVAADNVFVDIPSVTNMGEAVSASDTLLIYDASLTSMREIARSALVLSEAEVDAFVSNNGYGTGNVSSGITLTAGNGLTGGGDLSTDRTFAVGAGAGISVAADAVAVDINGTAAETTADNADTILIYDNSTTSLKKMTRANFLSGIGGADNLGNHTATTSLNMSGNSVLGGTAASADLTLESTSNATKGDIVLQPNGGNVGIGTTTPAEALDVTGNIKVTGTIGVASADSIFYTTAGGNPTMLALQSAMSSAGHGPAIDFRNTSSAKQAQIIAQSESTNNTSLVFVTRNTTDTLQERMRITAAGDVGIGTASPGAKLEVAGQVKITGGTPGAGKVLTSDASGLASWQAPGSGADNLGNHTATGALNMSSNRINNVTDPAAAQDAATKNYVDTNFITKALPAAPAAGQNGQALRWNNGGNVWEYFTSAVSSTTMTAGNGLTGGGDISANRTFNVGAGAGIGVAADSISVDIPSVTDAAEAVSGADTLLIYDASLTSMREIARSALVLSEAEVDAFVSNNGYGTGSGDLVSTNNLSDVANAGTARTNLGLAIGTNVQAYDADLDDLADGTLSASKVQNGSFFIDSAGTAGQVWTSDGSGVGGWTTPTNANTASTIVKRDASGNFSAGTITASLTGNVTGNVSGTAANVTGTVAVANGGTGRTSFSNNAIMATNGSGAPTAGITCATATHVLTWDGSAWACAAPAGGSSQWTTAAPDIYYDTGDVGVGTTNPLSRMHVEHNVNGEGTIRMRNPNAGANAWSGFSLWNNTGEMGWLWAGSSAYSVVNSRNRVVLESTTSSDGVDIVASKATGIVRIWSGGAANERIHVAANGDVGVGTNSPRSQLDVNGTVLGKAAVSDNTSPWNFATGNLQYTTNNCGAFALHNLKDGGSYTFVVQGATSATCSFTAFSDAGTTALTVHLPPDHGPTVASKHTMYNIMVLGTHAYFNWIPNF